VDHDKFRALCVKVADENDPHKIELLKQRMRLLMLADEPQQVQLPTEAELDL
jgi:hypothetical protein